MGGVQRAGRLTAAALASFAAASGERCAFISLNDDSSAPKLQMGDTLIPFTGRGRSKTRFLLQSLGLALQQPRLIVALHPNLAPLVAAMKFCAPRSRSVVFAHGIEVWQPMGSLREWALRRSDLVLAPSTDTARHLAEQQGIAAGNIRTLPWSLGPDADIAEPASEETNELSNFPSGRILLTVGRWDAAEAYKGVDHLIEGLPALLQTVPDVQLVAIGGGNDLPRLRRLAQERGVADHVHFLDPLPPSELQAAYNRCEVFALPSRGEGFGLVFIEAMAHGKPVVGGAHGGTPDIIENGVTGFLVQHGEVSAIVDRLSRLFTDNELRRQMGAEALKRVRRDYLFNRFTFNLSEILTGLLESK